MALLVDKHRPRTLGELTYHPELTQRLSALVRLSRLPLSTN
jgi:replication factor C subunit 3/5